MCGTCFTVTFWASCITCRVPHIRNRHTHMCNTTHCHVTEIWITFFVLLIDYWLNKSHVCACVETQYERVYQFPLSWKRTDKTIQSDKHYECLISLKTEMLSEWKGMLSESSGLFGNLSIPVTCLISSQQATQIINQIQPNRLFYCFA